MHLHLLSTHQFLASNQDLILAGKVTHGIGKVVKFLIGFGIVIGVLIALLITKLMRKK